jgi:tape measure domain-containing protein
VVLLAQLVTEYVADLSDLMSGATRAQEIIDSFSGLSDGPSKLADSFTHAGEEARALGDDVAAVMAETSAALDDAYATATDLESGFSDLSSSVSDASPPLATLDAKLESISSTVASKVSSAFNQAGLVVLGFGIKASEGMGRAASVIGSKLAEAARPVVEFGQRVNEAVGQVASRVSSRLGEAGTAISGFVTRIREALQPGSEFRERLQAAASAARGLGDEAERAGGPISSLGERLRSGGSSLLDFGSKLGMTIFGLKQLGETAISAAEGFLAPAASAEQIEGSLAVFTGSAEAAKREMQELADAAGHSPFETTAVDQFALKLQSVGISAQDVIPDFVALGDGLDAVGRTSGADLSQIADAFVKIKTQTKLTSETMDSFASMGIDVWGVLEKQTGKTHAELQEFISDGLYGADAAMRDLTQGMEANPLYKGQMANDANVFNGVVSTLKSNWNQLLVSIGSPVIKALEPLLANIAATLASPGFQEFASGIGQKIVDIFSQIGNFISTNVAPALQSASDNLSSPGFKDFSEKTGTLISTIFKDIGDVAQNIVAPAIKGVVDTISSPQFQQFAADIADIATKVASGLQPAIEKAKPIIEGLFDFIQDTAIPAADGIVRGVKDIAHWFEQASPPAILLGGALAGVAAGLTALKITQLVGMLPGLIAKLVLWGITQWGVAGAVWATAGPFILIGALVGLVIAGIVLAVLHWGEIMQWLGDRVKDIGNWFGWLFGQIGAWFGNIGNWFHDRFNEGLKSITDLFGNIGNWFGDRWQDIKNVFSGIGNWFHDRFTEAYNSFSNVFSGIGDVASSIFNTVGDGVKGAFNIVIDLINHVIDGINNISFDTPLGHVGFSIGHIPRLARGTDDWSGGPAMLGEAGYPELVLGPTIANLATSSRVIPLNSSVSPTPSGGRGGDIHIHNRIFFDGEDITDRVMKRVHKDSRKGPIRQGAA